MDIVLQYVVTLIPLVIAIISEIATVKHAFTTLSKAKETKEFKTVIEQNKVLISELREAKRLNKELLTKIDRIHRGE